MATKRFTFSKQTKLFRGKNHTWIYATDNTTGHTVKLPVIMKRYIEVARELVHELIYTQKKLHD